MTRPRNRLVQAGALSLCGHALVVGLAVNNAVESPTPTSPGPGAEPIAEAAASPTWVDLRTASEALPEIEVAAAERLLPQADQARRVAVESAPRRGDPAERLAAATDSGDGPGRSSPAQAFRRDRSTLRARPADNAVAYQLARERTDARSSSPQPIRQEPRVGIGDSARTRRRSPADAPSASESLPVRPDGVFDPQATAQPGASQQSDRGADRRRTDGALQAEQGRQRFDVETYGAAKDNRAVRAASDEAHPGRFELSAPSAPGPADGSAGQGPGGKPGAVGRDSPGSAPSAAGGTREAPPGPLAMSAAEREYQRALGEIQRRVSSALRFPKRLAMELEQGESVVRFVLRADGQIDGSVVVVKSAGFPEFDEAAVSAVTRAAPFPSVTRSFTISMPITFDNPMVR